MFSNFIKRLKLKLFYFDNVLTTEVFKGDSELCHMDRATIFAAALQRNGIKYIRRDPKTGRIILRTPEGLQVATDKYWAIFHEIFCAKLYELEDKYTDKPFAVFDLGLNRAYTSLYYSTFENCKVIYGYEPHPSTFEFASYNVNLNKDFLESRGTKINIFEYGIGDKDETISLFTIPGRDGVSTVKGCSNSAIKGKKEKNLQQIDVKICDVKEEFSKRFAEIESQNLRKILKIDVEGAEYGIFTELCKSGQIKNFDLIIGDSHNGLEPIRQQLEANGFILEHVGSGVGKCQEFLFIKA